MASPFGSIYTQIAFFATSLGACAVFAFLETSVAALRLFKLKELAKSTNRYRSLFESLEKNVPRVLSTLVVANALSNVMATTFSEHLAKRIGIALSFSPEVGLTIGILLATISITIFGEIIPKNLATGQGERLFKSTLWITNIVHRLFYPFVTILMRFSDFVISKVRGDQAPRGTDAMASEKEIRFLIEYISQKGLMDSQKTSMLQGIFELSNTPVKEIIVPADDIITIDIKMSLDAVLKILWKHQFSRIPVYEGTTDNVIGMVYQKDVFNVVSKQQNKSIREILRPILFVPETLRVNQLLRLFKQERKHLALVINEYGSIIGLVTLEDVLEEIVGDINDEHESVTRKLVPLDEGGWLAEATIELDQLSHTLGISFKETDAHTLGGFLTEQAQTVPSKGDRISYHNFYFQIQQATPKRILQVLIIDSKTEHTQSTDS